MTWALSVPYPVATVVSALPKTTDVTCEPKSAACVPAKVRHVERACASVVATLPIWPDVVPTVGPAAIPTPANTSGARQPMTIAWPPPDDRPLT
ncbi:Uncharacterised protein [Mycobacteroides abscessus]|nr:Uncharacterised protein [Mycobacteroides abscessus]